MAGRETVRRTGVTYLPITAMFFETFNSGEFYTLLIFLSLTYNDT